METLNRIFQCLFSSSFLSGEVLFLWHAGEPLTLPMSFYEQAFALQQSWNERGITITNALQTNATLITEKWCEFFKAHDVHVGVSLDGPQAMHDAHRVDRTGKGTFARSMRGVKLLESNHIAYTVISVITSTSVREPALFWRFFSELHPLSIGLNPEEVEGVNETSSLHSEQHALLYRDFVRQLLAFQEHDPGAPSLREFDKLKLLLQTNSLALQAQTNTPMAILNFDCEGNFSTFSPELLSMTHPRYGDFLFGNVFTDSLVDMEAHPKFQQVNADIQRGVQRCKETCSYFAVCGGGSPSNKLYENGTFDSTQTLACRLQIQAATDAVLAHMEEKYYLSVP
jgi:uncharacterized protein